MTGHDARRRAPVPPLLDWLAAVALRVAVLGAFVVLVVFVLARLRLVVLPPLFALVLATFLEPPGAWLKRRGLPPALAAFLVMGAALGVLVALGMLIVPAVAAELGELGRSIRQGFEEVERWLRREPLGLSKEQLESYTDRALDRIGSGGGKLTSGVLAGAVLAVELVSALLLTFVITFFYVKDGDRLLRFFLGFVREHRRDDARAIGRRTWTAVGGYVRGAAINGLAEGVLVAIALAVIGVPLVLPLAVLTFFGGFFPIVGAIAAGVVATLVALVAGGPGTALLVAALYTGVQQLQSNVLEPIVLGHAVQLHPLVILLSLTAGAVLGGIVGAFLAVPVTAVVVAAVDEARRRNLFEAVTETD